MDLNDKFFGGAMDRLKESPGSDVLHQGITIPITELTGVATEEESETEGPPSPQRAPGSPPPAPSAPAPPPGDHPDTAIVCSLLARIVDNQTKIITQLQTINEMMMKDRQIVNNLNLRVESLQKARMLGLTTQPAPSASTTPASRPTPHIAEPGKGPIYL
ncbi:unnamed protein product [Parnassius apollo]|uniref:(apollo) hypothetical protein n=1 Tax=Parnassius apollo TaxID=110799 RepID=A0A8S3XT19_PARAO|nr:unnamed protein product [Parnassius apollo]